MRSCGHCLTRLQEEASYALALHRLQETCSHFSSWETMVAEEENQDLSSTRVCSFLPSAPERSLLEMWLLAITTGHSKTGKKDGDSVTDEATHRRWTRFLGLWISLRLAGLIARTDTKNDAFWADVHREIEGYELCFLYAAWPLLDGAQRLRLRSRVIHLRKLCRVALPRLNTLLKADSFPAVTAVAEDDSCEAACAVMCNSAMRAAQCVAREYLRITWDILNPKQMPEVVDERLQVLFSTRQPLRPRLNGRVTATSALAACDIIHTGCMADLLQTLQRAHQQQHTASHTRYVWLRMVRTALLQIGYNLVVKTRAAMIDCCYFLLPAMMDFEACVTLCEVMESEKASTTRSDGAAAHGDKEEGEKRVQLRRTLVALFQSTQTFYEDTIDGILAGYRKSCIGIATPPRLLTATVTNVPVNPLAPPPRNGSANSNHSFRQTLPTLTSERSNGATRQQLSLSVAAYALLVNVVEPTCNILRRYPTNTDFQRKDLESDVAVRRKCFDPLGSQEYRKLENSGNGSYKDIALTSQGGVAPLTPTVMHRFVRFFEKKMEDCFTDALPAVRPRSVPTEAQSQAAMDASLVSAYLSATLQH